MKRILNVLVFSILLSMDIHAQWIMTGLNLRVVDAIVKDSLIYAISPYNLLRSSDNGATWDTLTSPAGFNYNIASCGNALFLYTLVFDDPGHYSLLRSTDEGLNWKKVLSGPENPVSMVQHGGAIFCSNYNSLVKSTDGGVKWDTVLYGIPYPEKFLALYSISGNLYAAKYGSGILKSEDNGLNWKDVSKSFPERDYCRLSSNGEYIFSTSRTMLFRSLDGESWDGVYLTAQPQIVISNILTTEKMIFASGNSIDEKFSPKVYAGNIDDNYWRDLSLGLPDLNPFIHYKLFRKDHYLFLASNWGLWRYDISQVLGTGSESAPEESFRLEQNYPNPFNPSTAISYFLSKRSFVELKVFDLLGREAAVLVNKEQNPGSYNVPFNAALLPSGTYVYTLRAGEFREAKKLLLIK